MKYDINLCRQKYPKEKLAELLTSLTYRELETKTGFSERVFSQLAKEYDIPKNYRIINKNKRKINFNRDHVMYLYNDCHFSLRRIAEIYNTTHRSVKVYLEQQNQEIRSGYSPEYYIYEEGVCNRGKLPYRKYNWIDSQGYNLILSNGVVMREHRYKMEQFLNRKLSNDEYVHHIDFVKTHNDIDNLFIFQKQGNTVHQIYHSHIKKHQYLHPKEFVELYEDAIIDALSYENLMQLYINKSYGIVQISKMLSEKIGVSISRGAITKHLKNYGIFDMRPPHTNQFDIPNATDGGL